MDFINSGVAQLREKHWEVMDRTEYELQEKSCFGEYWYKVGKYDNLDEAVEARGDQIKRWYKGMEPEDCSSLRIVMRHVVEVVL